MTKSPKGLRGHSFLSLCHRASAALLRSPSASLHPSHCATLVGPSNVPEGGHGSRRRQPTASSTSRKINEGSHQKGSSSFSFTNLSVGILNPVPWWMNPSRLNEALALGNRLDHFEYIYLICLELSEEINYLVFIYRFCNKITLIQKLFPIFVFIARGSIICYCTIIHQMMIGLRR